MSNVRLGPYGPYKVPRGGDYAFAPPPTALALIDGLDESDNIKSVLKGVLVDIGRASRENESGARAPKDLVREAMAHKSKPTRLKYTRLFVGLGILVDCGLYYSMPHYGDANSSPEAKRRWEIKLPDKKRAESRRRRESAALKRGKEFLPLGAPNPPLRSGNRQSEGLILNTESRCQDLFLEEEKIDSQNTTGFAPEAVCIGRDTEIYGLPSANVLGQNVKDVRGEAIRTIRVAPTVAAPQPEPPRASKGLGPQTKSPSGPPVFTGEGRMDPELRVLLKRAEARGKQAVRPETPPMADPAPPPRPKPRPTPPARPGPAKAPPARVQAPPPCPVSLVADFGQTSPPATRTPEEIAAARARIAALVAEEEANAENAPPKTAQEIAEENLRRTEEAAAELRAEREAEQAAAPPARNGRPQQKVPPSRPINAKDLRDVVRGNPHLAGLRDNILLGRNLEINHLAAALWSMAHMKAQADDPARLFGKACFRARDGKFTVTQGDDAWRDYLPGRAAGA